MILSLFAFLKSPAQVAMVVAMALALFVAVPSADADPRRVYTITDIPVDESADTTIAAQEKAFAAARLIAARRLIDKITLAEDRGAAGGVPVDLALAQRFAAAVDIVEEARGGGRYRGKLSVVLNPQMVRAHLTELGVPFVDTQAPLAVIVVQQGSSMAANLPEEDLGAIAPFKTRIIPQSPETSLGYSSVLAEAGAERVILVRTVGSGSSAREELTLWTPTGSFQFGLTAPSASGGTRAMDLREQLNASWKSQSIVRSTTRTLVQATARYTSLVEWVGIRDALAKSPLVSQFRVMGLAQDGAVVNFAFAGDNDRLANDLLQRGIQLDQNPGGWVMRSATFRAPARPVQ